MSAQPAKKRATKKTARPKSVNKGSNGDSRIVNIDGRDRRPWALVSKEKLLRAAIAEIADRGYEKARLVDIAKRADLTVGSIYTWFEDKTELFNAALEFAIAETQKQNESLVDTDEFKNIATIKTAHWLVVIASLLPRKLDDTSGPSEAQRMLLEALKASWRDEEAHDAILPQIAAFLGQYEAVVDAAVKSGQVSADIDPKLLARVMLALPVGLTLLTLAGLPEPEQLKFIPIFQKFGEAVKPAK
jgi:AcrR family transcriptional regulator